MRPSVTESLSTLVTTIEALRAPGGCPWDRAQTHKTLAPHMVEELYEVLEAVDQQEPDSLRDELGDLLLQVVMHAVIAEDTGEGFDLGDVADGLTAKMIARHPHVFSPADAGELSAGDVAVRWEEQKEREQSLISQDDEVAGVEAAARASQDAAIRRGRPSALAGIPLDLPALARCSVVQRKLARYEVAEKHWTVSEWAALALQCLGDFGTGAETAAEPDVLLGELLYAVVGLGRALGVDPEGALRRMVRGLVQTWGVAEKLADVDGVPRRDYSAQDWRTFLKQAAQEAPFGD